MKAIVYTKYGPPDVLELKEVEKPIPKDNEVLIRTFATPVSYGDIMARDFKHLPLSKFNMPLPLYFLARIMFGINKPKKKILGSEFAGTIEATGRNVKRFKANDHVFGYLGQNFGAYAEYICIPENGSFAIKPANMTYEEAACVSYGALVALNLLRKMDIQPGQRVLINGASGGIGSAAVQLAKNNFGAVVTGVCSTSRINYVKALGAEKAIDYTKEDFTKYSEQYDLIFDVLGKSSFSHCKNSLKENGHYLLASFKTKHLLQMFWTSLFPPNGKKVICAFSSEKQEDFFLIKGLVEKGKIKSIIDKCFPLEQAVEAHKYAESWQKKGNIVISLKGGNNI
jgi:NADPH:quinone reductase-like Zn-dependent oxidoreductase